MTTIAEQRQKWNAVPGRPAIRLRSQWGAKRSYADARTVTEPATRQFCHITVTNPANYKGNDAHAQAVENIGINRFPATGISYNWLVMPDGSLYEAQPVGRRGAHTVNDFKRSTCLTTGCPGRGSSMTAPSWNLNFNARAVVFCGIESTPVSDAVVETFARTIYTAYKAGFITKAAAQNIHGHRCVSSKSCPGNRMWSRMKDIQARVNKLIAGTPPPPPPPPPVEEDMSLDAKDAETVWTAKLFKEYVDERGDGTLDPRSPADILYATHRLAFLAATPNIDALAAAIVAKFPNAGSGSIDLATVKAGVREALREGVGDAPA